MNGRFVARADLYQVCGVPITVADEATAARMIIDKARSGSKFDVHLCNAYTLSLVDRDAQLRRALQGSAANLADGTPVAWLGRSRGMRGPVRGPSLVGRVARSGVPHGTRHYFYGGLDGVAGDMISRLTSHAPGLQVAGVETPPFVDLDSHELSELARRVVEARAHVLWIGLGTPRQDYLVARLADVLSIPIVPVGAAFDFWAGRTKEAPGFLRGTGLEWVHRLVQEPRRLWRRYLIGNPRFIWSALCHTVRASRGSAA